MSAAKVMALCMKVSACARTATSALPKGILRWPDTVSYTHLDVYKRQCYNPIKDAGGKIIGVSYIGHKK